MGFGSKPVGKTYKPFVTTDDEDIQLRGIVKKGNDYYAKFGKRGSIFGGQERFIGTTTGKGAKIGSVLSTTYRVEWERD